MAGLYPLRGRKSMVSWIPGIRNINTKDTKHTMKKYLTNPKSETNPKPKAPMNHTGLR
jgi:hypothetical protein